MEVRAKQQAVADYQGFMVSLHIRTLVTHAEVITPLGDLAHFANWRGKEKGATAWPLGLVALR